MNNFTRKFKELLYSIKTDDHYSEYDHSEDDLTNKFKLKEFNLTRKFNVNNDLNGSNGSSKTNLHNPTSAKSTGNDELNLSDDDENYFHNPNSPYANNDLEYSSENIHLSHLGDHKYRNSSNDLDDEDYETPHEPATLAGKNAPYENAIDDGSKEVILAWEYIKHWCSENSNDLYASLNDPCSSKDLKDVEKDLNLMLPKSFKVSLRIHDGQELDGLSGVQGLIYGLSLMTLDQIVSMQQNWNKIYHNLYTLQRNLNKLPKQGSIPPNYVKPLYCNPKWIPVVTDNAGNNIAIDLDPGLQGTSGQVIICGRDFDTKFVVAENWGEFLSNFVNDLKNGNWDLDEDEDNDYLKGDGELLFIDAVNNSRIYEDYLNVLKRRVWSSWKKQRDLELLAKNKPRFNSPPSHSQPQASHYQIVSQKNSIRDDREVERRLGSVRDFSSVNVDEGAAQSVKTQSELEQELIVSEKEDEEVKVEAETVEEEEEAETKEEEPAEVKVEAENTEEEVKAETAEEEEVKSEPEHVEEEAEREPEHVEEEAETEPENTEEEVEAETVEEEVKAEPEHVVEEANAEPENTEEEPTEVKVEPEYVEEEVEAEAEHVEEEAEPEHVEEEAEAEHVEEEVEAEPETTAEEEVKPVEKGNEVEAETELNEEAAEGETVEETAGTEPENNTDEPIADIPL